jgi:hypothetical protein
VPKLRADEDDAEDLADLLARREGLDHLRVRHRADLLTLESGDKRDPVRHVRFRRSSVHLCTLEAATHTGRWERTGFRDTLPHLLDVLVTTLAWTIAPVDG